MGRMLRRVGLGIAGVLLVLLSGLVVGQPVQVLPRMRPLPAFSLHDQQGRWVVDSELRGRIVLLNLSHSNCNTACAASDRVLRAVQAQIPAQVQLLMIDLDNAQAAQRRAYTQRLGADGQRWRVLSGTAAEIKQLVGGGLGIYYQKDVPAEPRLLLVDAVGLLRADYAGARLDAARLQRDILLLQREQASRGPSRLLYETAHLFVCYPN